MAKKKTKELSPEERLQEALVPEEEWPYEVPGNWCWTRIGYFVSVKGGKRVPKGKKLYLVNNVECRNINGQMMGSGDTAASSRLHALHVFVRATRGVKV